LIRPAAVAERCERLHCLPTRPAWGRGFTRGSLEHWLRRVVRGAERAQRGARRGSALDKIHLQVPRSSAQLTPQPRTPGTQQRDCRGAALIASDRNAGFWTARNAGPRLSLSNIPRVDTIGPISFLVLRFLLGAAEAGFFPGSSSI